jgi:hypothetical protein
MSARYRTPRTRCLLATRCDTLSGKQGSVEMRKITFAVYNPPKEGLPYLSAIIAPTGAVAAVAYQTAAEAEAHNLKLAIETARAVE